MPPLLTMVWFPERGCWNEMVSSPAALLVLRQKQQKNRISEAWRSDNEFLLLLVAISSILALSGQAPLSIIQQQLKSLTRNEGNYAEVDSYVDKDNIHLIFQTNNQTSNLWLKAPFLKVLILINCFHWTGGWFIHHKIFYFLETNFLTMKANYIYFSWIRFNSIQWSIKKKCFWWLVFSTSNIGNVRRKDIIVFSF